LPTGSGAACTPHKTPGYAAVTLSLKAPGVAPGDISDAQMIAVADLAERFSFGEAARQPRTEPGPRRRPQRDLHEVWQIARSQRLATANIGLLTDMICCPGGDLCSLANARSIPIAEAVNEKFDDLDYLYDIGDISLNISGCMNSCGHHHVANIGILGVDKNDEEWYQITIGGQQGNDASDRQGDRPSFYAQEVPEVIEALIAVYVEQRTASERFIDTCSGSASSRSRRAPTPAAIGADRQGPAREKEVVNA
jgi:sulfite reductase (NADPH) hemoprotein beta-component